MNSSELRRWSIWRSKVDGELKVAGTAESLSVDDGALDVVPLSRLQEVEAGLAKADTAVTEQEQGLLKDLEAAERRAIEAEGALAKAQEEIKDLLLGPGSSADEPPAPVEGEEQVLPITDEVRAALLKLSHRAEHEAGCGTETFGRECTCGLSDALNVVADRLHSTTKDPEEGDDGH